MTLKRSWIITLSYKHPRPYFLGLLIKTPKSQASLHSFRLQLKLVINMKTSLLSLLTVLGATSAFNVAPTSLSTRAMAKSTIPYFASSIDTNSDSADAPSIDELSPEDKEMEVSTIN